MALDVVCFFRVDGELKLNDELPRRILSGNVPGGTDVAGYAYLVTGPESIEDDLLLTVAKSKRPVAVFDELGTWPTRAFLRQHPNVRVVNDTCAACALELLVDKKVAVPAKISIISVDDLPIELTSGISSFNFNCPAVMIAMLGYITNPRVYPVSRQLIGIEGQIIPRRRTVGSRRG